MSLPGNGIFVVRGEISTLTMAIKRGTRWNATSYQVNMHSIKYLFYIRFYFVTVFIQNFKIICLYYYYYCELCSKMSTLIAFLESDCIVICFLIYKISRTMTKIIL